jgi:hypothetical protein
MSEVTAEKLVEAYVNMRESIADKTKEIETLKVLQKTIADKILELCNGQNMNGFQTPYGTVSRGLRSHYWTSDWESMYNFIKKNDAFHLLEKRIHNTNLKEFLTENPDMCPEGLQSKNEYTISVRKPTKK